MAIRKIREIGDEVLTKVCKEVTKMTPRTTELIDDMLETCLLYTSRSICSHDPDLLHFWMSLYYISDTLLYHIDDRNTCRFLDIFQEIVRGIARNRNCLLYTSMRKRFI